MTDEELLINVMREAQLILAEPIDRRSRDPGETVTHLLSTARKLLQRQDVFAS
jgi:urease gamma subunit